VERESCAESEVVPGGRHQCCANGAASCRPEKQWAFLLMTGAP
jgi:hypothetical protein